MSCVSSLQSSGTATADPEETPAPDAMIELRHAEGWIRWCRSFQVFINDRVAGEVARKIIARYRVHPGCYSLSAKSWLARTQTVHIRLEPNERIAFACGLDRFQTRARVMLLGLAFTGGALSNSILLIRKLLPQLDGNATRVLLGCGYCCVVLFTAGGWLWFCRLLMPGRALRLERLSSTPHDPDNVDN